MSTERCECSPPKFLSAFGRRFKHPSHYRDCPMYEEPNEEQKANARNGLVTEAGGRVVATDVVRP